MSLKEFTVVFPSYRCREYVEFVIDSFEKFNSINATIYYVVVENSDDVSYKDTTINRAPDRIKWVQNLTHFNPTTAAQFNLQFTASFANAEGVRIALDHVNTEFVFIAHADVCVVSNRFLVEVAKLVDDGYSLIGTVKDNARVNAIHVSGFMVKTDIAKDVSFSPVITAEGTMLLDVGDAVDIHCRRINAKTFCFKNTENDISIENQLNEFWKKHHVDRCVIDNEVIFIHLGRGTPKSLNTYNKPNRIYKDDWVKICGAVLNENLF